jgi:hypothetical protein
LYFIAEILDAKKSDRRLPRLNPAATCFLNSRLLETILVFLVKCAICILLVFVALQWRADDAPAAKKSGVARHEKQQKPGGLVEDVASLLHAGGDVLAGAVRDKCLAAPRDCVSAAQRLQSAAGRAH